MFIQQIFAEHFSHLYVATGEIYIYDQNSISSFVCQCFDLISLYCSVSAMQWASLLTSVQQSLLTVTDVIKLPPIADWV